MITDRIWFSAVLNRLAALPRRHGGDATSLQPPFSPLATAIGPPFRVQKGFKTAAAF